jgi:hypothetical protein
METKRDVFIKLETINEIEKVLTDMNQKQKLVKKLFEEYDTLSIKENKIFDNWEGEFENLQLKMGQVTI